MFRLKLEKEKTDLLKIPISIISEIIDEGIFVIDSNGFSFKSSDRTAVAIIDFKIYPSSFSEFNIDGKNEIGLNTLNLVSIMRRVKTDDVIIIESSKNLEGNDENSKITVTLKGKTERKFDFMLLDLKGIKKEVIPTDMLKFDNKTMIISNIIEDGIADAETVSDALKISMKNNNLFSIRSEGETSSVEIELKRGDYGVVSMESSNNETIISRYSIEYLKKMIKASKISENVSIEFSTDYPLKLAFKNENAEINFILAPRVD